MLMQSDYLCGVADVSVGQLRHVHQSILMDANVHEGTKVGDVRHDARQFHTFVQVVDGLYAAVKFKLLNLFTRVTTRLLQFLHDVCQRGYTDLFGDVFLDVYLRTFGGISYQVADAAMLVLRHLLYHVVALWVNG